MLADAPIMRHLSTPCTRSEMLGCTDAACMRHSMHHLCCTGRELQPILASINSSCQWYMTLSGLLNKLFVSNAAHLRLVRLLLPVLGPKSEAYNAACEPLIVMLYTCIANTTFEINQICDSAASCIYHCLLLSIQAGSSPYKPSGRCQQQC